MWKKWYEFSRTLSAAVFSLLFLIRYKPKLENIECALKIKDKEKGTLFIVNHTSLVDGPFFGIVLWAKMRALPLVVEEYFFHPNFHWYFAFTKTLSIPNFSSGTYDFKEKKLQDSLNKVAQYLAEGQSVFFFPSGGIKTSPHEHISGNTFLYELLKKVDKPKIILVHISGLWGSSFSCAYTGEFPNLLQGWGKRILQILANGIFFMPKRVLTFKYEEPIDFPFGRDKQSLKHYLMERFHASFPNGEPAIYRPYYFWEKETKHSFPEMKKLDESLNEPLKEEIYSIVSNLFSIPKEKLTPTTRFGLDLGLDSLDLAQLSAELESKYDLGIVALDKLYDLNDLVTWVEKGKLARPVMIPPIISQKQLPLSGPSFGDLWTYPITDRQFQNKVKKYVKKFASIQSDRVGIMLLHSVESMAVLFALQRAGKEAVIIDWLNDKEMKEDSFDFPIVTSSFFLDYLNKVNLYQSPRQFIYIDRLHLKNSHESLQEAKFDHWPDYKKIEEEIKKSNLPKEKGVAIIHNFTNPLEVSYSLALAQMGYPVFFISPYRNSSKEIKNFLKNWEIETIF